MAKLRLKWNNQENARFYDVILDNQRVIADFPAHDGPVTEALVSGIAAGRHIVQVVARESLAPGGDFSLPSDPFYVTVYGDGFPVPPPEGVGAMQSLTKPRVAEVFWDNVPAAAHYDILVDDEIRSAWVPADEGGWSYAELAVSEGARKIEVVAIDSRGNRSDRSLPFQLEVKPPHDLLSAPFLKGELLEGRVIRLAWTSTEGAVLCDLFVNGAFMATVPAASESYELMDQPSGTYDFTMKAHAPGRYSSPMSNVARVVVL